VFFRRRGRLLPPAAEQVDEIDPLRLGLDRRRGRRILSARVRGERRRGGGGETGAETDGCAPLYPPKSFDQKF
jgi:hypothetical protein